MEDGMAEISVALTTTGFAVITGTENTPNEIEGVIQDIPVCCAYLNYYMPEVNHRFIEMLHKELLNSLKIVVIDSEVRTVFIGEDTSDIKTALIFYKSHDENSRSISFFERWNKIGRVNVEYTINRINKLGEQIGILACVSGEWSNGKWFDRKITAIPRFTIKEPE